MWIRFQWGGSDTFLFHFVHGVLLLLFHRILTLMMVSFLCVFTLFLVSFFLSYLNSTELNEWMKRAKKKHNRTANAEKTNSQKRWKGNSIFRVKRFFLSTIFPVEHVGMWFINFYFYIGLLFGYESLHCLPFGEKSLLVIRILERIVWYNCVVDAIDFTLRGF